MSIAEKLTTIAENHQKVYSDFWYAITNGGKREVYLHAFRQWGGKYIRPTPPYQIKPVNSNPVGTFRDSTELEIIEQAYVDLSNCSTNPTVPASGHQYTFRNCTSLVEIQDIGMKASFWAGTFTNCPKLHTIGALRFSNSGADTGVSSDAFTGCTSLENITTIDGYIRVDINFRDCPLTAETAKKVIEHLDSTVSGKTVTFSDATKAALDAANETIFESGLTWSAYILSINWTIG